MSRHAFIDESTRGSSYLICAATVAIGDLDAARRLLLGLRARGQGRLHFATESDRRRRQLLTAISSVEANSTIFVASHRDQVTARSAIVRYAAPHLHELGVRRLVIEARQGQDQRDRADLYAALGPSPNPPMSYLHHTASAEPLLWIPDAVAWAWGRGGAWRKRVEDLGLVVAVHAVEVP